MNASQRGLYIHLQDTDKEKSACKTTTSTSNTESIASCSMTGTVCQTTNSKGAKCGINCHSNSRWQQGQPLPTFSTEMAKVQGNILAKGVLDMVELDTSTKIAKMSKAFLTGHPIVVTDVVDHMLRYSVGGEFEELFLTLFGVPRPNRESASSQARRLVDRAISELVELRGYEP